MAKQKIDFNNLPSNNETTTNAKPLKLRGAVKHKKSGGLASEVRDVFNNQFTTMMIPAVMRLIYDFLEGALRMMILGDNRGYSGRPRSYNRQYRIGSSAPTYRRAASYRPQRQRRVVQETPYEDVIFTNRKDAEDAWHAMMDITDEYGWVTVGHLYSMVGERENFSHHRWGWTDVSSCGIVRADGGGFIIDLPNPVHR